MASLSSLLPVSARKTIKLARARTYERFGSDRHSFPALNSLDRKMIDWLPTTGTFLEVGGNDGYSQSNTYYLERKLKWSGILIEPIPELAGRARRSRPGSQVFNLACVDPSTAGLPVSISQNDLMSVTLGIQASDSETRRIATHSGDQINVGSATISSVINHSRFSEITFMSVDVEGAESALLAGLEMPKHTPEFLLIETNEIDRIRSTLEATMTLIDQLSHHDFLFQRRHTTSEVS